VQGKIALSGPATDDTLFELIEAKNAATQAKKAKTESSKAATQARKEEKIQAGARLVDGEKEVEEMTGVELSAVAAFKFLTFPKELKRVGERKQWLIDQMGAGSREQRLVVHGQ